MIRQIDGRRCPIAKLAQQIDEKSGANSLELIANLARLFWDDVADWISALLKQLVEESLDALRAEALGAGAWERTEARTGHRDGSYGRRLQIRWARWGFGFLASPMARTNEIIDRWGVATPTSIRSSASCSWRESRPGIWSGSPTSCLGFGRPRPPSPGSPSPSTSRSRPSASGRSRQHPVAAP